MSFMTCCVLDCSVTLAGGGILHRFPNPKNEKERFQAWTAKINGEVATLDHNYVFNNRRICHKHFDKIYCGSKNRLTKTAVPTIHLSGSPIAQETVPKIGSPCNLAVKINTLAIPSTSKDFTLPVTAAQARQSGRSSSLTHQEIKLVKMITDLKKDVFSNKVAKKPIKQHLQLERKSVKHDAMQHVSEKRTKAAKTFIPMQIKQAGKKNKGRRPKQKQGMRLALGVPRAIISDEPGYVWLKFQATQVQSRLVKQKLIGEAKGPTYTEQATQTDSTPTPGCSCGAVRPGGIPGHR